jgi:PHD/YefM family antitoxin component YafN of YafNO toxin-antitoxin module
MIGVSDFRASLAKNLARATRRPLVITDHKGGGSFVVLSAHSYNNLIETLEDELDARELARLVAEHDSGTLVPWKRVRNRR